jgi:hypothetical protein
MTSSLTADPARDPELARCFVELGDPVAGYSPNFRSRLLLLAIAALVLLLGPALVQRIPWLAVVLLPLGILGIVVSIAAIKPELRSMPYRICPGGIVALPWRRIECFPWRDVAALQILRTTGTMRAALSAIVTRKDGRKFELKRLSPEAVGFVQEHIFREMAPRVLDELNRGLPVRFGDLEMRPDALVHKRERILWEEIEKVEFSHRVVVHKHDGTRAYFFDVANLDLFLALAHARLTTGRFEA